MNYWCTRPQDYLTECTIQSAAFIHKLYHRKLKCISKVHHSSYFMCSDPSYLDVEFTSTTFAVNTTNNSAHRSPSNSTAGINPLHVKAQLLCAPANLCHEVQRWLVKQSGAFIKSHSIMLTWNKLLGIINTASSDLSIANEILESVYIV